MKSHEGRTVIGNELEFAGGLQSGLSCAAFTCAISVFIDKMQPEAATASEGLPLLNVITPYLRFMPKLSIEYAA